MHKRNCRAPATPHVTTSSAALPPVMTLTSVPRARNCCAAGSRETTRCAAARLAVLRRDATRQSNVTRPRHAACYDAVRCKANHRGPT